MVSKEKIQQKFALLEDYLNTLQKISQTPVDQFLRDKILIGSAKYYLQVSIECCLDVAHHIISAERFRAPSDYADSFRILEEQGMLDKDLMLRLQQMAKFRNRLVHLYGEIDNQYIFKILSSDLEDFRLFEKTVIERFLD